MQSFKRNFTWNYKKMKGISKSIQIGLWQYGSWDHVIRNETDYDKHIDYIHYNPVKHGYVSKPEDFTHYSYIYTFAEIIILSWIVNNINHCLCYNPENWFILLCHFL